MLRWIVCLIALASCDKVFGLKEIVVPDARMGCPVPDPDLDDDGDGTVNALDPCPLAAYEDTNDEDMDGTLDDCDLCPQLAGDAAGADLECDGLGAACDPDGVAINLRRFHGFKDATGLEVDDTFFLDGAAQMPVSNVNQTSKVTVIEPGQLPAQLALEAKLTNVRVFQYWSYELHVIDGARRIEIQLEKLEMSHRLNFVITDGTQPRLSETTIGTLLPNMTDLSLALDVRATPTGIAATIDIDGIGVTMASVTTPIGTPFTYGVVMNRNMYTVITTTIAETAYLVYTTLVPE